MVHFLRFIRLWLPAIVVTFGVVVIAVGRNDNALDGGAGIIGAGLSIWLMNFLWRVGVRGDSERDEEADARAFFDRWGHWPDEPGPGSAEAERARVRQRD
jgi:hypothetical protein